MKSNYYLRNGKKWSFLLLFLFLSGFDLSNAQVWTKVEGTGFYINDVYLPKDNPAQVVVATTAIPTDLLQQPVTLFDFGSGNDGYIVSNDSGKTFGNRILPELNVFKLLKMPGSNLWLASVRNNAQGGIMVSSNNGSNWSSADILKCAGTEQIVDLIVKPGPTPSFFAGAINTGSGIKMSADTFATCQSDNPFDISTRCIKFSPLDSNMVFAAGDAQYYGGVIRSYDGGKTWMSDSSGLTGLRILCVQPSAYNRAIVYCGADSLDNQKVSHGKGIYQSLDTGKTWKLVGAQGARVLDISQHPLNARYLAAACDTLGVYISGSYGYGWEQFNTGLPANFSVRKVAIPAWVSDTGAFAFAYVYGQGLYKSTKMITDVKEQPTYEAVNNLQILNLYPQPFSSSLHVTWMNPVEQNANISVRDILGREVYNQNSQIYPQGENIFNWSPEGSIQSGVYYLVISSGNGTATAKVMFNK